MTQTAQTRPESAQEARREIPVDITESLDLWIARDKDGLLFIFEDKPRLRVYNGDEEEWESYSGFYQEIDSKSFPSVTFWNSPQKLMLVKTPKHLC